MITDADYGEDRWYSWPGAPTDAVRSFRVLVVDDEDAAVRTLERVLARQGIGEVRSTTDPRRVLALHREFSPDLVILDLQMPGLDGYAVIRQLTARVPQGHYLPILVISGEMSPDAKRKALTLGASDFVSKPYEVAEVQLRVRNLLRIGELTTHLEERVRERTAQVKESELDHVTRLALVSELRDYGDGAHVQRVGRSSARIASRLGMTDDDVHTIRYAAPLHDLGKIAIPDSILLKQDALTLEDWDVLKTHTTLGAQMLTGSRSPILQMAEEIALYHHENWNGTGYTPGLAGEGIPLVGRIVACADVFDALTHTRSYKAAMPVYAALEWMETMREVKFDPRVLDALLDVLRHEDLTILSRDPNEPPIPGVFWTPDQPDPVVPPAQAD